jgi:DsbE subfamily thiol:disulfide oxidoreductase
MTTRSVRKKTKTYVRQTKSKTWLYVNMAIAVMLIVGGIAVLFWMGEQDAEKSTPTTSAKIGATAANFQLPALSGESVALSDYEGQVILVNTWATWCPPCKAEMPAIHEFYQAHQNDGFVVLAINSQEDAATVQRFINAQGFTFPVLLDTQASVLNQYKVRGLPTSFVIDRDGVIRYIHSGAITRQQLEDVISPLL